VVCDVNLTAGNVRSLQQALGAKGYYGGPLDGVIGPLTLKAANDYAEARGLPGGSNYIAVEVVDALGLSI